MSTVIISMAGTMSLIVIIVDIPVQRRMKRKGLKVLESRLSCALIRMIRAAWAQKTPPALTLMKSRMVRKVCAIAELLAVLSAVCPHAATFDCCLLN